jgi:predicted O-methyltransferase YrrM
VNPVLDAILTSERVSDASQTYPLRHPDFPDLPVHLDRAEGELLQRIVAETRPSTTLEVGFAYGVSTLYICEALAALRQPVRHIVIDPHQTTQWRGIGLMNVGAAGFEPMVDFHEDRSEHVLPELLKQGETIDLALIDGWHTFDQVMVEFYYLNRLLGRNGVIVFDDADRPSVNRVIRHALTYPAYRLYGADAPAPAKVSLLGRARRAVARVPGAGRIFRSDFLRRDWDLGICASCVAIQKIDSDRRTSGWDQIF